MSSRISPFEALTGSEKQIKWLEYQSIRLPYVKGDVDASGIEEDDHYERAHQQTQKRVDKIARLEADIRKQVEVPQDTPPEPPKRQSHTLSQTDFQKSRHHQYDSVIARMKQAEKRTGGFQTF